MTVSIKPIYLGREDAAQLVALSVSAMEALIRADAFPKPRQLGPRRVGWLVRELEAWSEARPVSGQLPPENCGRQRVAA